MEEMGMGSIFKNALKNQIKTTSPDFFFSIRLTDSSLPLRIYLHAILQMSYSRFYNSKVARHEVWLDTELFSMVIVLKNSDNNIVKWFGIFDTLAWNLFFKKKSWLNRVIQSTCNAHEVEIWQFWTNYLLREVEWNRKLRRRAGEKSNHVFMQPLLATVS